MTNLSERYILGDALGSGGMGTVYHATDRLTQQALALKMVNPAAAHPHGSFDNTDNDDSRRLMLAREFQLLAGLRHPHIIEVLDYGFSAEQRPFYTMQLLGDAQDILSFSRPLNTFAKIDLMIQTLRALQYLHRRKILHRDIKPTNLLVDPQQHLYLLDFGLAVVRGGHVPPAGSIPYLAPEILRGQQPTVRSDLFAAGVIFYEMLLGRHPFASDQNHRMIENLLTRDPDLAAIEDHTTTLSLDDTHATDIIFAEPDLFGIDNAYFANILRRLLARNPQERFASANAVMHEIAIATDHPIPADTSDIRRSIIRKPNFVGRQREIQQFQALLNGLQENKQSQAWLVAGESGVGKSRLVEEIRIRALVQDVLVLSSRIQPASTYRDFWGDIPRRLALSTPLNSEELSQMRLLVPDIAELVGHAITTPPPPVDASTAEENRLQLWQLLFERQARPVLVILEDLHWAIGSQLRQLHRLIERLAHLPILWLMTYRGDEYPALPRRLPSAKTLKVPRFAPEEVLAIAADILGEESLRPHLTRLLTTSSGGNAFILIEIIDTLAEWAGGLDRVHQFALPDTLVTDTIASFIERRLEHVPYSHRHALRLAALAGQKLDLAMLSKLIPPHELRVIIQDAHDAALLTIIDGDWYFVNNQTQKGIITHFIEDAERQILLHRQLAEAIESTYGDIDDHAIDLSMHYGAANDSEAEAHYAAIAGEHLLRNNQNEEAILYLSRALESWASTPAPAPQTMRRAYVCRLIATAYHSIGDIRQALTYCQAALDFIGDPLPPAKSLPGRIRAERSLLSNKAAPQTQQRLLALQRIEAALILDRLSELATAQRDEDLAQYAALRGLNFALQSHRAALQARLLATVARLQQLQGRLNEANYFARRAQQRAANAQDPATIGWTHLQIGRIALVNGRWDHADSSLHHALTIFESMHDTRRMDETNGLLAVIAYHHMLNPKESERRWQEVLDASALRHDTPMHIIALSALAASNAHHIESIETALDYAFKAAGLALEKLHSPATWAVAVVAAIRIWQGRDQEGASYALQAADSLVTHRFSNNLWQLDALDLIVRVLLHLLETTSRAPAVITAATHNLMAMLQASAVRMPIATPIMQRWEGTLAFLKGNTVEAERLWQSSLASAENFRLPLQSAYSLLQLQRLQSGRPRQQSLDRATSIFARIGASTLIEVIERLR